MKDPARIEILSTLEELAKREEVEAIKSLAQNYFWSSNWDMPWDEAVASETPAIRGRPLMCLYQAVAEWLGETEATLERSAAGSSYKIRSPESIKRNRRVSPLDLGFLLAAVAFASGFRVQLLRPRNGGSDPLIAVLPHGGAKNRTGVRATLDLAGPSSSAIMLAVTPLVHAIPNDRLGRERYWLARKKACEEAIESYFSSDLGWNAIAELRDWLRKAVFQVLRPDGQCNGTGFFVSGEGVGVTCYHVLFLDDKYERGLFDEHGILRIRIGGKDYHAQFCRDWSNPSEDVAVVRLLHCPPGVEPLPLRGEALPGVKVLCHGFRDPSINPEGEPFECEISQTCPKARVYFEDGTTQEVLLVRGAWLGPGLSGSPVVSERTGCVLGIETGRSGGWSYDATGQRIEHPETGYAVPIEKLTETWRDCPVNAPSFVLV